MPHHGGGPWAAAAGPRTSHSATVCITEINKGCLPVKFLKLNCSAAPGRPSACIITSERLLSACKSQGTLAGRQGSSSRALTVMIPCIKIFQPAMPLWPGDGAEGFPSQLPCIFTLEPASAASPQHSPLRSFWGTPSGSHSVTSRF